jgi:peptide/nickel transport system permease protein
MIAIPVGVIAATRPYSLFDQVANTFAFIGFSLPTFFTGLLFILFFSIYLDWLPFVYRRTSARRDWPGGGSNSASRSCRSPCWDSCRALVDAVRALGGPRRHRLDYITTARSKGVAERWVVIKHALRNALIRW